MAARTQRALLTLALTPDTDADQQRLAEGLRTLIEADPIMTVRSDAESGHTIVGAFSETHLDIIIDRLRREFNVAARVGRPRVVYEEVVTVAADGALTRVVLEPIMHLEVMMPPESLHGVLRNLSDRRGHIQSREQRADREIIRGEFPFSEMFGFRSELNVQTQGRGTFTMWFARYQPCPPSREDDEAVGTRVPVPRNPVPSPRRSSIALPEPVENVQDLSHPSGRRIDSGENS